MKRCPHCECAVDNDPKGVPRSPEQLRRYFAVLRAAFLHWPETAEHTFSNETELRKYLQMKAGYREIGAKIPLSRMSKEQAMFLAEAAIRGAKSYAMPIIHGDTLVIFNPKSIAFKSMSHDDFCKLNRAVDDIIRSEIGVEPDDLISEMKEVV